MHDGALERAPVRGKSADAACVTVRKVLLSFRGAVIVDLQAEPKKTQHNPFNKALRSSVALREEGREGGGGSIFPLRSRGGLFLTDPMKSRLFVSASHAPVVVQRGIKDSSM